MYELTEEGFSSEIGSKKIQFRNENFTDGGNRYEGEALFSEERRVLCVIRFRSQVDGVIRPILIDAMGELDLPDLQIDNLPEGDDAETRNRYFDQIYTFLIEQLLDQEIYPLNEFRLVGSECLRRTVRPMGGGAGVYVPKDRIGEEVRVVLR